MIDLQIPDSGPTTGGVHLKINRRYDRDSVETTSFRESPPPQWCFCSRAAWSQYLAQR